MTNTNVENALTFRKAAVRMVRKGIPIIPIAPGTKRPCVDDWENRGTTSPNQILQWSVAFGNEYGVGCVATPDGFWYLDCDNPNLPALIEEETGQTMPRTFTVASRKGKHLYWKQTPASRAMGNRWNHNAPYEFDAQVDRKQVIAPGSTHPSGYVYSIVDDCDIVQAPDWLVEWVSAHGEKGKATTAKTGVQPDLHPDFDPDRWYRFNDISGHDDGEYFITDECPIAGHKHEQSTRTGFFYNGTTWGFHCFAGGCDGSSMSVGDVVAFINRKRREAGLSVWNKPIWEEEEIDFDNPKFRVEDANAEEAEIEEGQKPTETPKPIKWEKYADALDDIREGKEIIVTEKGTKTVTKPEHKVDEDVFQFVVEKVIEKRCKMYCDAYSYIFVPSENRLFNWKNDNDCHEFMSRLRLRLTQRHTKLVKQNVELHVMMKGEHTRIEKWGCMKDNKIYVNNGRGGMFRLSADGDVDEVPNGTDGVLVLQNAVKPWPTIAGNEERIQAIAKKLEFKGGKISKDSALCRHFNGMFDENILRNDQYQQMLLLRYLSLFGGNTIQLRPILMSLGEQGSGKSTLWEKLCWLLEDIDYESGALPTNLRSFIAAVTNSQMQIFDNVDGTNFANPKSDASSFIDLMCKASTGGKISVAELYKTNVSNEYSLRCDLFLTARVNPFPAHRSDLSRRMLFFPVRKPEANEYITVRKMKQQLQGDSDEMKLETLVRLQFILKALVANQTEYTPVSEMHDYENWTRRIAEYEGWGLEMLTIWNGCKVQYQERVSEDSPMVDSIRRWIGSNPAQNVNRWVRASEIYKELAELYPRQVSGLWKTSAIFGKRLKETFSALRILNISDKKLDGYCLYQFNPSPTQSDLCLLSYRDSVPDWKLKSDAEDEQVRNMTDDYAA